MRLTIWLWGLGAIAALLLAGDAAAQCAMCKTALQGGDPAQVRLAEAFYYSILMMFAMPFSIVGLVGGMIYRAHRRQQRLKRTVG